MIEPDLLSLFPSSTTQEPDGGLAIAGVRLSSLADDHGTPVLVVDEPLSEILKQLSGD